MSRLGVCYQGSKNQIAKAIVAALPSADTFVDLFAGGCAVTHAAMISGKYKRFIANDFGHMPQVFLDAIHGAASDPTKWFRWVSRAEFKAELAKPEAERNQALLSIWSFGNTGTSYLYGRPIEAWKHALWRARVDGDFGGLAEFGIITDDASRLNIKRKHAEWSKKYVEWAKSRYGEKAKVNIGDEQHSGELQSLERLEGLERLQSLQQLQSLAQLESLQRLEILRGDYRDVVIPENSVVYCDPPYAGTDTKAYAGGQFDHAAFWEWARMRPFPVYVSEYHTPEDFAVLCEITSVQRMNQKGATKIIERVFVHKRFYEGSVK